MFRWLSGLHVILRSFLNRRRVDQELDAEMQYHLDCEIEEHRRAGLSPEEARYAALRAMGAMVQNKEECRDVRGINFMEHAMRDLRYGVRVWRKNPGFAFAVIATLALGIGATTAVFSVVYGVVLRPLPFPHPEQLVNIGHSATPSSVGASNFRDWRAQNSVFDDVGITKNTQNFNITGDGEPERVLGGRSTASVLKVLGVSPLIGRVYTDEDGMTEDKVVLSYGLWNRRYAADPGILGKTILLNGKAYTILGVMPASFQYPNREFELWTPLKIDPNESRQLYDYRCIARLKAGVSLERAQSQMAQVQSGIGAVHPEIKDVVVVVSPMLAQMVGNVRTPLYVLMGAVLCLLLIGCANLANLLVARAMARSHELVLRAALGARRERLILQSIMELVPLVVLGGIGAFFLSEWLLSLLVPLLPSTMPRLDAIQLDWRVLAFGTLVLLLTATAIGMWPAYQVRRWNLNQALRESSRTTISGHGASRLRSALVVGQIAAVVVLMVVSALLIRSFVALRNVDPGFRTENILTVHFALSEKYSSNPAFGQYLKGILDHVSVIPGVVSVGIVNRLPLAGQTQTGTLQFEGMTDPLKGPASLDWRTATPDYFRTLGIPLIEGRFFEETDAADHPRVGIVDESLARTVWPGQSAIGKRFRYGRDWYEIVGVVGHLRHDELGIDQRPQVYWNYHQRAQPRMALAVRTRQDPRELAPSVIAALHEVDPEQPVYDVRTMDEVVERSLAKDWLNTALLSLFAAIALILASIGVYGVMSYSVGLRSREIGIRIALGSRSGEVIWMILRQAGVLVGLGIGIGVTGALMLGRILTTLLYGIQPTDVVSYLAAALTLGFVALAASFIPARRAARIDPMQSLRAD